MTDSSKGHFWYSAKQADLFIRQNSSGFQNESLNRKTFCIINGKEYLYTAWTKTKDNSAYKWDDLEYLGEGTYSRTIGYW